MTWQLLTITMTNTNNLVTVELYCYNCHKELFVKEIVQRSTFNVIIYAAKQLVIALGSFTFNLTSGEVVISLLVSLKKKWALQRASFEEYGCTYRHLGLVHLISQSDVRA